MSSSDKRKPRIRILGAGPTGLGAAYRLQELGYKNWSIFEAADVVGGLARSFTDEKGFTYDIGGHIIASHYEYYDKLVDKLLGNDFTRMQRQAWIYMMDTWVPYPFQNNIRYLPSKPLVECLMGLLRAQSAPKTGTQLNNFREFTLAHFGAGIANYFMLPYNFKVWAHPAEIMSKDWIGERVATIDIERILRNIVEHRDDVTFGPHNWFKFPLYGGTGGLFSRYLPYIQDHLQLNTPAIRINPVKRTVWFANGSSIEYDFLLSTMPLLELLAMMEGVPSEISDYSRDLLYSSGYSVGIGIDRPTETNKCWIYFPEENTPFYRVTYLSQYSPNIAPPNTTLLLAETSESLYKPVDRERLLEDTINGLVTVGLMEENERDLIIATKVIPVKYWYPIPSLNRDRALSAIQPYLMKNNIFSRGRFGSWLYEVGNMDHATMMGVEFVNNVLNNEPEITWQHRYSTDTSPAQNTARQVGG